MPVRLDPTKAGRPGECRKLLQHKIGTDIGPGKAPISDFMLIRRPERNLLALSYNVLRYVKIALILQQYKSIRSMHNELFV